MGAGEHRIVFRALDITPGARGGGSAVHPGEEPKGAGPRAVARPTREHGAAGGALHACAAAAAARGGAGDVPGAQGGVPMARVLRDSGGPPSASLASWEEARAFVGSNTLAVVRRMA